MQNQRRIIKSIATGAAFLIAFLAVGFMLSDILQHKWGFDNDNAAQQIVRGYYEEPEESLDVLFLGASTVRNGVSPLEMYAEYGITGYSRATSIQDPIISYYLLLETLEKQDIKAVVMDSTTLTNVANDVQSIDGKRHEAVDYMPMSRYKLKMISEITQISDMSILEFVAPIYTYHDRWSELEKEDFTYREWGTRYPYKGQYPTLKTKSFSFSSDYMSDNIELKDEAFQIDEEAREYFEKMIQLCNERGIEFIMLRTPVASWDWDKHNLINTFAEENGVTYLDYCLPEMRDEIGFNESTDFCDQGSHLNITGAQKISRHLGALLAETIEFEDKRNNETYEQWYEDYLLYESLLVDVELMRETNLVKFLDKLNNDNYTVMIATRDDTAKYFNADLQEAFNNLGIQTDFGSSYFQSFVAVLDKGKLIYEESSPTQQVDYSIVLNEHDISLSSFSNQATGNLTSIMFDGEDYSPNSAGFNFVVYDNVTEMIITRKAFNSGRNGKIYTRSDDITKYSKMPKEYFKLLLDENYISVITVAEDAAQYMPGSINDQLEEMGLIPIDGAKNRPYIAIINSGEIEYNEYGVVEETLAYNGAVDGVEVDAMSSCDESSPFAYIQIGDDEWTATKTGMYIMIYDKKTGEIKDTNHFAWRSNYTSEINFTKLSDPKTYIESAQVLGYDVICLANYEEDNNEASKVEKTLRDMGFSDFESKGNYIGIKHGNEVVYQENDTEAMAYSYDVMGENVQIDVARKVLSIVVNETKYARLKRGTMVVVYDPVEDAVLEVKQWN